MIHTVTRGLALAGAAALVGAVPLLGAHEAHADGPWPVPKRLHVAKDKKHKTVVKKAANVSAAAAAPGTPILPGKTYTWPYAVTNTGGAKAERVTFTATLSKVLRFVSATGQECKAGIQAAAKPAAGKPGTKPGAKPAAPQAATVTCDLGEVGHGQTKAGGITATVVPDADPGEVIKSGTRLHWTGSSARLGFFRAVRVADFADLAIGESGPSAIRPGWAASYTVKVTNKGPSVARGVVVKDVVQAPARSKPALVPSCATGLAATSGSAAKPGPGAAACCASAGTAAAARPGRPGTTSATASACCASAGAVAAKPGKPGGPAAQAACCAASGGGAGTTVTTTCGVGDLKPGESRILHVGVRSGQAIKPGTVIMAPSEVQSTTLDTDMGNNEAATSTKVTRPAAALVKSTEIRSAKNELPATGAPVMALLNVAAALLGAGLVLYRLGRPRAGVRGWAHAAEDLH